MTHRCGLFRALVVNVSDPLSLGRIQVQCPQLFGNSSTDWIMSATTPAVGSQGWLGFEAGDEDHPVWLGSVQAAPSALSTSSNVWRILYNTTTSTWPARPSASLVPAGYAEYVSSVSTAPLPPDALLGDTVDIASPTTTPYSALGEYSAVGVTGTANFLGGHVATTGNLLMAIVATQQNLSSHTVGWSLDGWSYNWTGISLYTKTSTGTETSFSQTLTASGAMIIVLLEWPRLQYQDVAGNSGGNTGTTTTLPTPSITTTHALDTIIAAGAQPNTIGFVANSWTGGFTDIANLACPGTGATTLYLSYLQATATGAFAPVATMKSSDSNDSSLIAAYVRSS